MCDFLSRKLGKHLKKVISHLEAPCVQGGIYYIYIYSKFVPLCADPSAELCSGNSWENTVVFRVLG